MKNIPWKRNLFELEYKFNSERKKKCNKKIDDVTVNVVEDGCGLIKFEFRLHYPN